MGPIYEHKLISATVGNWDDNYTPTNIFWERGI